MDTKFKNKDLLIQMLDRCIEFKYYPSAMVDMRYMITHNNATFEQALNICMLVYSRDRVYHIISRMYHKMIRTLNNEKSNMKKGIDINE